MKRGEEDESPLNCQRYECSLKKCRYYIFFLTWSAGTWATILNLAQWKNTEEKKRQIHLPLDSQVTVEVIEINKCILTETSWSWFFALKKWDLLVKNYMNFLVLHSSETWVLINLRVLLCLFSVVQSLIKLNMISGLYSLSASLHKSSHFTAVEIFARFIMDWDVSFFKYVIKH